MILIPYETAVKIQHAIPGEPAEVLIHADRLYNNHHLIKPTYNFELNGDRVISPTKSAVLATWRDSGIVQKCITRWVEYRTTVGPENFTVARQQWDKGVQCSLPPILTLAHATWFFNKDGGSDIPMQDTGLEVLADGYAAMGAAAGAVVLTPMGVTIYGMTPATDRLHDALKRTGMATRSTEYVMHPKPV